MRLIVLSLCLLMIAPMAMAGRVALVLGNGDYTHADPLKNAVNDASDMADRLRGMGFDVYEGLNLSRADALRLVQEFALALDFDDTALFFYAGHGMQLGSDNYIMPVDARPGTEAELTQNSIRVQTILSSMENAARTRLVILDACRNNPFVRASGTRAVAPNRGFIRMEAGVGSFIAFSTEPGNVAADGTGRNSPFTAALLRHIETPGADIHAVMRAVRSDVIAASNETQVPWENSALSDQVFLTAAPAPQASPAPSVALVAPQADTPRAALPGTTTAPYQVSGLTPGGDGFLALRDGPSGTAALLQRMPEGLGLLVTDRRGSWLAVRTEFGEVGWAHARWVRRAGTPVITSAVPQGESCDALWDERNAIYHAAGYCFTSARGQARFPAQDCIAGLGAAEVELSPAEKSRIDAIVARERQSGCR